MGEELGGLEFYTDNRFARRSPVFDNFLNTSVPDCSCLSIAVPACVHLLSHRLSVFLIETTPAVVGLRRVVNCFRMTNLEQNADVTT